MYLLKSILKLKNSLYGKIIDVLIHNAAIAENNTLENLDTKSLNDQFNVNAILTNLLFPTSLEYTGEDLNELNDEAKAILADAIAN